MTIKNEVFQGRLNELLHGLQEDQWISSDLTVVSKDNRLIRWLKSIPLLIGFDLFEHVRTQKVIGALKDYCFSNEVNLNDESMHTINAIFDTLNERTHHRYQDNIIQHKEELDHLYHRPDRKELFFVNQVTPQVQDEAPFEAERELARRVDERLKQIGIEGELRLQGQNPFESFMRQILEHELSAFPTSPDGNRYINSTLRVKIELKIPKDKLRPSGFGDYEVDIDFRQFDTKGLFPNKNLRVIIPTEWVRQGNGDDFFNLLLEDQTGHILPDGTVNFPNGKTTNIQKFYAEKDSYRISSPVNWNLSLTV